VEGHAAVRSELRRAPRIFDRISESS
jgi:hypothetical protein